MKITLITATFNSEKNITDCLRSVAEQSFSNIEHIIIDGGSTDKTPDIVKSFQGVSRWISEPDNGIYDALNKGIQLATGDIIGFLHSDDMLAFPDTLQNIINIYNAANNNRETVHGVYGNLIFTDSQNTDKIVRTWQSKPFNRKNVKYGWMPPHPTLFLRKEVYEKHGYFDTSFKIAGDYNFVLKIMLDKDLNLKFVPKIIIRMRTGGASTGSIKGIILKSREDIRALHNNGFKYPLAVLAVKNLRKLPQLLRRQKNI